MKSSTPNPLNTHCTGCGVCVSESGGALVMAWNEEGFFYPRSRTPAEKLPERVIRVCPFNPKPEKVVEDEDAIASFCFPDAPNWHPRAGRYQGSYIGYSKTFRRTSSSGGIATEVFKSLLEGRHVESIFVVLGDGENGYKYALYDDLENIGAISKTRYFPVTLDGLFDLIDRTEGRIAVSGVACFIKAIRLKQHYHPELKKKIPFLVGIICGGLKSRFFTDFLAQSAGIEGDYSHPEYRIKDARSTSSDYSFGAYDGSVFREMKMSVVGDMWGTGLFKSRACDFCTDVLTELADISLGDAWLPEYRKDGLGNSVVVTRSLLAESIVQARMRNGEFIAQSVPVERIIESQRASFSHRQDAVRFRSSLSRWTDSVPTPFVRGRVTRSVSLPFAIVQILRERTRRKSIEYWRGDANVARFNRKMKLHLSLLRFFTKVYHKLRLK